MATVTITNGDQVTKDPADSKVYQVDSGARLSTSFADIRAALRTELNVVASRCRQSYPECASAVLARVFSGANLVVVYGHIYFACLNNPRIITASVASLTRWNQIIRRVVSAILIQVVGDEFPDARAFAWHPVNRSATPMARMRSSAYLSEQYALMFSERTSQRCEWMIGVANAQVGIRHVGNSI